MRRGNVLLAVAAFLVLLPAMASAQEGSIAGSVRDASDALIPGVTVEVASPALIEKVRTAVTDSNGQYRVTNLPVDAIQEYQVNRNAFAAEFGFTDGSAINIVTKSGGQKQ